MWRTVARRSQTKDIEVDAGRLEYHFCHIAPMDHLAIFNEVIQAEYKENGGCVVNIRLRRSLFRSFTFWIGMGRGAPRGMRADGSRLSCRRASCRAVRFARWWAARRLSPRSMRTRQGSLWQAPLSAAKVLMCGVSWCHFLCLTSFPFLWTK